MRAALRSFETEHTVGRSTWQLTLHTERDEVDNLWLAECQELPGCMSQGATESEALENIADAIGGVLVVRMQSHLQKKLVATTPQGRNGRTVAICV